MKERNMSKTNQQGSSMSSRFPTGYGKPPESHEAKK